MKRNDYIFPVEDVALLKQKILQWSSKYAVVSFLDNNEYDNPVSTFECIAAVGCIEKFDAENDFFQSLSSFVNNANDWIFGHLNYDIKNYVEDLYSENQDNINFPDAFFFVPEIVLILKKNKLTIGVIQADANKIFTEINLQQIPEVKLNKVAIKSRISREEYIENIKKLQQNILYGECYEINYCQEFYAENIHIKPVEVFSMLNKISPNPFSAFYKLTHNFLLCASPESYLKKEGKSILSRPIKGTAKRGASSEEDNEIKQALFNSAKDRKENIIVVDLVRNDLSKVCIEGSVEVPELCEVYTFPVVHQMISSVKGTLQAEAGFGDIIKATFPMGSMTGAPKKRVMQLIEQFEQTKRGIYSGTVGYITPDKNFDFNVVIRSIMYNETNKYVSYQVGGAITFESDPKSEYEECMIKAEAMNRILSKE